jgi:hypothetical protein
MDFKRPDGIDEDARDRRIGWLLAGRHVQEQTEQRNEKPPRVSQMEHDQMCFFAAFFPSVRALSSFFERSPHTVSQHTQYCPRRADILQMGIPRPLVRVDMGRIPPPALTDTEMKNWVLKHYIIFVSITRPNISVRQLSSTIRNEKYFFACGKTKVEDYFKETEIRSIQAIKRPNLTPDHIERRKRFAENMLSDMRIFLPWVFTDECKIELNPVRQTVRIVPGLSKKDGAFQEVDGHSISVMIWASVAHNFRGPIEAVNGTMNAIQYQEIVDRSGVIKEMNQRHGENGWIFQEDNASPHRAKTTRAFLSSKCLCLSDPMAWPAKSPDLNCIEPLWYILKYRIDRRNIRTQAELLQRVKEAWESISQDDINRCVDRFPNLLRAVIANQGKSLSGQRDIMTALTKEHLTPGEIIARRDDEEHAVGVFCEMSQEFFHDMKQGQLSYAGYVPSPSLEDCFLPLPRGADPARIRLQHLQLLKKSVEIVLTLPVSARMKTKMLPSEAMNEHTKALPFALDFRQDLSWLANIPRT